MPTNLKRVQVLLRPEVLELVEAIAEQDNLSNSKVVALLAEEALVNRGLFKKEEIQPTTARAKGKATGKQQLQEILDGPNATVVAKKTEEFDSEDLALLQKIKKMKEMGVL